MVNPKYKHKNNFLVMVFFLLALGILVLTGCGTTEPQTFTVGVVNLTPALSSVFDGFKAGLTDLGYVEGENITYIYHGATSSIEALGSVIQNLLAQDVDLLLAISTPAALAAKQAVAGTDIPVVFAPVSEPVRSGVVDSLSNPGGNLTGIRVGGFVPKGLEWLLKIAPDVSRIFVAHNSDDNSSVQGLVALNEAAITLNVEIVIQEVHTSQEITLLIETIPEDIDAIFILPDNLVLSQIENFAKMAQERNLPLSSVSSSQAERGALMGFGPEFFSVGEQAARLADQILMGTDPADLPVETTEFFLTINLKTAEAIGIDISDNILRAADEIIR